MSKPIDLADGLVLLVIALALFGRWECTDLHRPKLKACMEACRKHGAVAGEPRRSDLQLCRCYRDKGQLPFDMVIGE